MAMDEKYLLYDSQAGRNYSYEHMLLVQGNLMWLWNDRLLLVEYGHDDGLWHFTALDLITNEARVGGFQKSDSKFRRIKIVSLNKDYGFVVESVDNSFCVNLVKLNWASGELELIERFDQPHRFSGIIISNLNPTKFVLQYCTEDEYIHKAGTLDSGKIELDGGTYKSENFFEHYFNEKMFVVYDEAENFNICTYDWMTKKSNLVQIDMLPNVKIDITRIEWVKERLYAAVRFGDTGTYGIGYTDLKTLNWNFLDLTTNLRISKMQFFGGNLLVYAANNTAKKDFFDEDGFLIDSTYCYNFKVYNVPIQHPQPLRKMAWPLVVRKFKRDESIYNPYQEAAKFLPFNSDLRAPWYEEETALGNLEEPESNGQGQAQREVNSTEETAGQEMDGKTSESTSSKESSDSVPPKRSKFN